MQAQLATLTKAAAPPKGAAREDLRLLQSRVPPAAHIYVFPELDDPVDRASIAQQHIHALRFIGSRTIFLRP